MHMKDVHIGIVGGTGGIGRWFADFFRAAGHSVRTAGRASAPDIPAIARESDILIVSVPIDVTVEVIRQVGPHVRSDSLFMDLTSLKSEPLKAMLASSSAEVIGCHPLFGPDVSSIAGQNVVLCPGRGRRWLDWITGLLREKGAGVVETTPERHDRMMAVVQGLTHLDTVVMGLTLRETGMDPNERESFSTPAFRARLKMIEKVFGGNPGLYASIIMGNPDVPDMIRRFEKNLLVLKELVARGDVETLREWIRG
jgi:prephenate dehydrogenase